MLYLSDNAKTKRSLNFSRRSCVGLRTRVCAECCYGTRRNGSTPCVVAGQSTSNNGPITRPTQQKVYEKNLVELSRMGREGELDEEAARIARRRTDLRICGLGELTSDSVVLCVQLALAGCKPWGFSRNAWALLEMAELCDAVGIPVGAGTRPMFQGSVDVSTRGDDIIRLIWATRELTGRPRLAFMARSMGDLAFLEERKIDSHVQTILGYHATSSGKTRLDVPRECPATAGDDIDCHECGRCIG